MEIFGREVIIGNFVSTAYNLYTCSKENDKGDSQDEVFGITTEKQFIGENPNAVYISQRYESQLQATVTFMKDPCKYDKTADLIFTEYELRSIMRLVTGTPGYQWLRILPEDDVFTDDIWYRARVSKVTYNRINGQIMTFTLELEIDSYMGFSKEMTTTLSLIPNTPKFMIIRSDDLNNYVHPYVEITPGDSGTLEITGDGWTTVLENVVEGQTIKMDCKNKILTNHSLNDFNLRWIRLYDDKNEFTANMSVVLKFVYRLPRKVGFICR